MSDVEALNNKALENIVLTIDVAGYNRQHNSNEIKSLPGLICPFCNVSCRLTVKLFENKTKVTDNKFGLTDYSVELHPILIWECSSCYGKFDVVFKEKSKND